MSEQQPQIVVYDPRLSAGRGAAFSAGALVDEDLEDKPITYYPEGDDAPGSNAETALDSSNKGFQLLQKMGWKGGKGLGKKEDGRVEPISAGVDAGVRLGLGKQEEDDKYTSAENVTRKKLESEIQAEEDPERTKRREAQVDREQRIKEDVSQIMKTFYCEICHKQYANAMEVEQHLSSYDHHHKKRMAETRAMLAERTRDERQRKEAKAAAKEAARLEKQAEAARAAAAARSQQQQQKAPAPAAGAPPLPPEPPPALPVPAAPQHQQQQQQPMASTSGGGGLSFGFRPVGRQAGPGLSIRPAGAVAPAGVQARQALPPQQQTQDPGGWGNPAMAPGAAASAAAAAAAGGGTGLVLGMKRPAAAAGFALSAAARKAVPAAAIFQESSDEEEGS